MTTATATFSPRFPSALQSALDRRGWSQSELARRLGYNRATITAYCLGTRPAPAHDSSRIARLLDDGEVYSAIIHDFTGGVGPLWLDGDHADLHRCAVALKVASETTEAMAALSRFDSLPAALGPATMTAEARAQARELLHQGREAIQAWWLILAVLAPLCGESLGGVWDGHRAECFAKGYARKEGVRVGRVRRVA